MTVTSRIDDLRRRVARDPASIAFAQLAEEHRRAGDLEEAVRVARAGLVHLPEYLSARVTLGRALLQLDQIDDAWLELESVLAVAPDNLAAVRAMAEIHERRRADGALAFAASADAAAGEPTTTVADRPATATAAAVVEPEPTSAPDSNDDEIAAFLDQLGQFAVDESPPDARAVIDADREILPAVAASPDPAAAALERWLAAIMADRATRG